MVFVCRFDEEVHAKHTAHILNVNAYKPLGISSETIKSLEDQKNSKYGVVREKEIEPLDTNVLRLYGYFAKSSAWWVVIRF